MRKTRQNRIKREAKARKARRIRLAIMILPIIIFLGIFYYYSNNLGVTLLFGGLILFGIGVSQLGGNIERSYIDGSSFDSGYV